MDVSSKLIKNESGMTMALAVIMIALIGVMGAGLLVFVGRDLDAVAEVNRGQKAFEIADAGVQVAKQQIRRDAEPEHYDVDDTSVPLYYDTLCNDPGDDSTASPRYGDDWSPEAGVSKNFAGGTFDVTIRWLSRSPSADARCKAPIDLENEPTDARFFLVTSTGRYNGAVRKVEAIFSTYDIGMPKAYFTPETIGINGTGCISNISVFSLKSIELSGGGNGCKFQGGSRDNIMGADEAYGNWQNDFNTTPRGSTDAGFGSPQTVDDDLNDDGKVVGRDFDMDTNPKFVENPSDPQPGTQITFPFDHTAQTGQLDDERMAFYEEEAKLQGNYRENPGTNLTDWPDDSNYNTVVYIKFTSTPKKVDWNVDGNCEDSDDDKKGILIIDNGSLNLAQHTAGLNGYVLIRGGTFSEFDSTGGNTCFKGYINASGDIKVGGSPSIGTTTDLSNSPGFYGVRLWSWRELYE